MQELYSFFEIWVLIEFFFKHRQSQFKLYANILFHGKGEYIQNV